MNIVYILYLYVILYISLTRIDIINKVNNYPKNIMFIILMFCGTQYS
jgi:hypothetical protein